MGHVAKIIIEGPAKSYKSTLACIIKNALHQVGIKCVHNKDEDWGKLGYSLQISRINHLTHSREPVEIEVRQTNREPKRDCYHSGTNLYFPNYGDSVTASLKLINEGSQFSFRGGNITLNCESTVSFKEWAESKGAQEFSEAEPAKA